MPVVSKFKAACSDLLHKRTVFTLTVMLCGGVAVTTWHVSRQTTDLIEAAALQGSQVYSGALTELRTVYNAVGVERVRPLRVPVTHDYLTRKGAIPLPATFTIELGERIAARDDGMKVRLYSDYPFPWRRQEGGPRDDFERQALRSLRANPRQPVFRFEDFQGRPSLRYATADLMRPQCVACHKTHPDSPRRDWKEGDVRGVLEVIRPMDTVVRQTRQHMGGTLTMIALMAGLGLSGLALIIGRLHRTSAELEGRVEQRTSELTQANRELHRYQESLEERVQERTEELTQANQELVVARDAAEAANRAKSQFLSNMSHELRTPLNAIIGFSEVLSDGTFGELNPKQARHVNNVLTSGRRLLQLINDVLDLARVEAGRMELDLSPFNVAEALHHVETMVKTLAAKKRIELRLASAPDLPPLNADQPKFKHIFYNLVSNAIKYTPEGGSVEVTASSEEAQSILRVSVRDTGVGLQPENLERIFARFEQLDASFARQQHGAGVGLALTRMLVELHGGRIWAESEGEGKGSTFTVLLPMTIPARQI